MPVCAFGSQPRPNVPATLVIDPRLTVSTFTPGLEWINPFLPFLPTIVIDTPTFCAAEPPGNPTLDATDLIDLLNPSKIGLAALAAQKLEQLLRNYVWYSICECSGSATPAPPTAPAAPTGTPVINPPTYFPLPAAGPCLTRETTIYDPLNFYEVRIPEFLIPTPGPTRLFATITSIPHGTVHNQLNNAFDFWNAAHSPLATQSFGVAPGTTTVEVSIPTGAVSVLYRSAEGGTGIGTDEWRGRLDFYCGGGSPADPYSPCCPPDAALSLAMQRLEVLATLIQRQAVPFGYVPGTLHSNLSGAGELAVTGLIGAKVTITASMPGTIGSEVGHPEHLFGAGWIQWGTTDGFGPRVWLDQVDTLSLPGEAGAYTALAYSLPPGLVVDILELVREP